MKENVDNDWQQFSITKGFAGYSKYLTFLALIGDKLTPTSLWLVLISLNSSQRRTQTLGGVSLYGLVDWLCFEEKQKIEQRQVSAAFDRCDKTGEVWNLKTWRRVPERSVGRTKEKTQEEGKEGVAVKWISDYVQTAPLCDEGVILHLIAGLQLPRKEKKLRWRSLFNG